MQPKPKSSEVGAAVSTSSAPDISAVLVVKKRRSSVSSLEKALSVLGDDVALRKVAAKISAAVAARSRSRSSISDVMEEEEGDDVGEQSVAATTTQSSSSTSPSAATLDAHEPPAELSLVDPKIESVEAVAPKHKVPSWLGKKHKEESKRKIAEANKGRIPWNKGRKHSEETKAKIAERTRQAMADSGLRSKLAENSRGKKHTEATKMRIQASSRQSRFARDSSSSSSEAGEIELGAAEATSRKLNMPKRPKYLHSLLNAGFSMVPNELRENIPSKRNKHATTPLPIDWNVQDALRLSLKVGKNWTDFVRRQALEIPLISKQASSPSKSTADGAKMSESARQKLSARIKALWADPEYRRRVREGMERKASRTHHPLSPEHKEKIRQTLKKRYAASKNYEPRSVLAASQHQRELRKAFNREQMRRIQRRQKEKERRIELEEDVLLEKKRVEDMQLVKELQASGFLPPLRDIPESTTETDAVLESDEHPSVNVPLDIVDVLRSVDLDSGIDAKSDGEESDTDQGVRLDRIRIGSRPRSPLSTSHDGIVETGSDVIDDVFATISLPRTKPATVNREDEDDESDWDSEDYEKAGSDDEDEDALEYEDSEWESGEDDDDDDDEYYDDEDDSDEDEVDSVIEELKLARSRRQF